MTHDEFAGLSGDDRAAEMRAKAARLLVTAEACEKGAEGERSVAELLRPLTTLPGWHVLHDRRRAHGSPANIDHIVVGPNGVTVIDAKNWSGNVTFARDVLRQNGYRRDDALGDAWRDAAALATEVGVPTRAALCLTGSGLPETSGVTAAGVGVMRPEHLLLFVQHGSAVVPPDHTADIAAAIDRCHPPRSATVLNRVAPRGVASRPPQRPRSATVIPTSPFPATSPRLPSRRRRDRAEFSGAPRRVGPPPPVRGARPRRLSPELRKLAFALLFIALLPLYPWADRMVTKAVSPIVSHELQTAVKGAVATSTPGAP